MPHEMRLIEVGMRKRVLVQHSIAAGDKGSAWGAAHQYGARLSLRMLLLSGPRCHLETVKGLYPLLPRL